MTRPSNRQNDELRQIRINRAYTKTRRGLGAGGVRRHQGAVHRQRGREGAGFLRGRAAAGLPPNTACCRARPTPAPRARLRAAKQSGRTQEIQRLIGRSLRAVADLSLLGERTIQIAAT